MFKDVMLQYESENYYPKTGEGKVSLYKQRGFWERVVDPQLCYTEGSLFLVGPFKKRIRGSETARLSLLRSPRQILDDIFTTRSEEPTSS